MRGERVSSDEIERRQKIHIQRVCFECVISSLSVILLRGFFQREEEKEVQL